MKVKFLPYSTLHELDLNTDGINPTNAKVYQVYGIRYYKGNVYFFICDDPYCYEPNPYKESYFEVVDNKIPTDWKYIWHNADDCSYIVPYEWAENKYFYENLIDSGEYSEEKEIFKEIVQRYKKVDLFNEVLKKKDCIINHDFMLTEEQVNNYCEMLEYEVEYDEWGEPTEYGKQIEDLIKYLRNNG